MNTSSKNEYPIEFAGSNPLRDLAEHFGVSLEAVYCYAWRSRGLLLSKNSTEYANVLVGYWSKWAVEQIGWHAEVCDTINHQVRRFLVLQGHLTP